MRKRVSGVDRTLRVDVLHAGALDVHQPAPLHDAPHHPGNVRVEAIVLHRPVHVGEDRRVLGEDRGHERTAHERDDDCDARDESAYAFARCHRHSPQASSASTMLTSEPPWLQLRGDPNTRLSGMRGNQPSVGARRDRARSEHTLESKRRDQQCEGVKNTDAADDYGHQECAGTRIRQDRGSLTLRPSREACPALRPHAFGTHRIRRQPCQAGQPIRTFTVGIVERHVLISLRRERHAVSPSDNRRARSARARLTR